MRIMKRHGSIAVLLCAALLSACGEDAVQEITGPLPASRIKFFNFGVNAPGVNFYLNDTKMTAITSATGVESTTGVAYGGVGSGGLYSGVAPGTYSVKGRIAAITPVIDSARFISDIPVTIADGKYYSAYQSGFYNTTTKLVDGFVVEDAFPAEFDYETAYVRFVNAISNSSPMTLYALSTATGATEVAVGGEVAYKAGGVFTKVAPGTYTLNTRTAGSAANAVSRTGVQFVAGRVYTIGARGDITVATGTNARFLDNTLNR
jgi:hypothetical protein